MKDLFIENIEPGLKVDGVFILAEKTIATKKDGSPYMNVVLSDKTGSVKCVMWDKVEKAAKEIKAGDYVVAKGSAAEYRGGLQVVIKEIGPCLETVDPADFLKATQKDIEGMFTRLLALLETITDAYLTKFFDLLFSDEELVTGFKNAPAAKSMHHAYIGGLLEHTLSMAVLVDLTGNHYSGVNRDVVLAGVVIHDIGKIVEYQYTSTIDYSDAGMLLHHIPIGVEMIAEKINQIDGFPQELAMHLKHLIVSHHGTQAFGSPLPPRTLEAVFLHHLDDMDSKIKGVRDYMEAADPNETWTGYHWAYETKFYKGKP